MFCKTFPLHCFFLLCTMLITSNFNISLNRGGGSYSIHVGEVKESEIGNKGQRLSVAEVIAHENYRGSSNSFSNDIALLRLSSKAIFNDFVRPACIGTNIHSHYDYCYITGWGYTHYETWQGKYYSCVRKIP